MLMDRYLELVRSLYAEPKNEVILGSFMPSTSTNDGRKEAKKSPVSQKKLKPRRDIRTMFVEMSRRQDVDSSKDNTDSIVIYSD